MLSNFIKNSWLVMVSSLVFGLLVAGVHEKLQPQIKQNAIDKLNAKMQLLLPDASGGFDAMRADDGKVLYYVGKDGKGEVVGYAMNASGGGFADVIGLLVAFDAEVDELEGIAVLKCNETPGFGDKIKNESKNRVTSFKDQFEDCPIDQKLVVEKTGDIDKNDDVIVAISGATISSDAVTKIVNDAVKQMRGYLDAGAAGQ